MDDSSRTSTPGPSRMSDSRLSLDTIDELTAALADHSRASPEPDSSLTCCCGRAECENLDAWRTLKSKLESRLVLSAEIGQALLHRHEGLVRHSERNAERPVISRTTSEAYNTLADLREDNAEIEKRLNRALIHSEILEENQRITSKDLEEARETISRLTVQHARTAGIEARLSASQTRGDDLQAELDSEMRMRKIADARIAALTEHTNKLQSELRRLRDDLERRRSHRAELSESILQDARSRLQSLKHQSASFTNSTEQMDNGVQSILESLVADNEVLHHGNAELQTLLADARETSKALQEELEEQRASSSTSNDFGNDTSRTVESPDKQPNGFEIYSTRAVPLSVSLDHVPPSNLPPSQPYFSSPPPTETGSVTAYSEANTSRTHEFPPMNASISSSPIKNGHHMLPHLENEGRFGTPSDLRSESSSEAVSTFMSTLLDRVVALLNRMTQTDALTLTNRLKRQNLKGADIGHLSKSTVQGIIRDVQILRSQFPALQDEKATTICTRKDLRVLFKLFKELFEEMGNLRITLNSIILDPSTAVKVSEATLDPAKAAAREREAAKTSSWISPLSKLFGSANAGAPASNTPKADNITSRGSDNVRPPLRPATKLSPALAASTTTVNVEFSGSGVGRSTTSVAAASQGSNGGPLSSSASAGSSTGTIAPRSMMSLWAGAPRPAHAGTRPSVAPSFARPGQGLRPQAETIRARRLSRVVDAVIDVTNPMNDPDAMDGDDMLGPLLHRPLRRRGLSDSSIHSTYTSHGDDKDLPSSDQLGPRGPSDLFSEGPSVFRSISQRVQSLRLGGSPFDSNPVASATRASPTGIRPSAPPGTRGVNIPSTPERRQHTTNRSASSFIPILGAWGIGEDETEVGNGAVAQFGSVREDSTLSRWGRDV